MHALGNNYIYVDTSRTEMPDEALPDIARVVSDVRRGIGSDGLILIQSSNVADVGMRIYNADGSEAESCGNGLRCVAKYAYEHQLVRDSKFTIETKAGIVQATCHVEANGLVHSVTIDMGLARFGASTIRYAGASDVSSDDVVVLARGQRFVGTIVNVGNPHFVTFVDEVNDDLVAEVGPHIESHPDFPDRINAEFIAIVNRREIDFRVYERGSGITFACGTGACAAVASSIRKGVTDSTVRVHLLGGHLDIEMTKDGHLLMTGEAIEVARGEFNWV